MSDLEVFDHTPQEDKQDKDKPIDSIKQLVDGKEYSSPEVQAALDLKRMQELRYYITSGQAAIPKEQDQDRLVGMQTTLNVHASELGALQNSVRQKGFELPGYREAEHSFLKVIKDAAIPLKDQVDILGAATSSFELSSDEVL